MRFSSTLVAMEEDNAILGQEVFLAAAFFMDDRVVASSGQFAHLQLKAWHHEPIVLWELRRLFLSFGFSLKQGAHRHMSDLKSALEAFMMQLGFDVASVFNYSRTQLFCQNKPPNMFTHDEATISTLGLLSAMVHWACHRRSRDDKKLAVALLELVLHAFLPADHPALVISMSMPEEFFGLCDNRPAGLRMLMDPAMGCVHCQLHGPKIAARLLDPPAGAPRVAHTLQEFGDMADCPSFAAWLGRLLAGLAKHIDGIFPGERMNSDVLLHGRLDEIGKRRLDEDLKRAISNDVSKMRKVSGADYCRATGVATEGQVAGFDQKSLREQLCADVANFQKAKVVSVAMDAARLGEPKKDICCYHLFAQDLGVGTWLTPQVPRETHKLHLPVI